jgi:hypothetical protein
MGAELFLKVRWSDGRADRHNQVNSCFSQLFETTKNGNNEKCRVTVLHKYHEYEKLILHVMCIYDVENLQVLNFTVDQFLTFQITVFVNHNALRQTQNAHYIHLHLCNIQIKVCKLGIVYILVPLACRIL